MDMRALQYFLSVAKHLNFTKAANECFVAQAAISQQIDKLEKELGFLLFHRSKRAVALTPAGAVFAEEVQKLQTQLNSAVAKAAMYANGQQGALRIGLLCQYEYTVLNDVLQQYRKAYPEVEVLLSYTSCRQMEQQLRSGELDIALASLWEFSNQKDILVQKIYEDTIVALLRNDHPLAHFEELTPDLLEGQDIVMIEETTAPHLYARMREDNRAYGYEPQIAKIANTFDNMLMLVDAGLGIALFPSRIGGHLSPNTKMIPLAGSTMVHELAAARRKGEGSPTLGHFYRMLLEHFVSEAQNGLRGSE